MYNFWNGDKLSSSGVGILLIMNEAIWKDSDQKEKAIKIEPKKSDMSQQCAYVFFQQCHFVDAYVDIYA